MSKQHVSHIKSPAPVLKNGGRNKTISLTTAEIRRFSKQIIQLSSPASLKTILDKTICEDSLAAIPHLPDNSVDLLFADPPYNLTKSFNRRRFYSSSIEQYEQWLDSWLKLTPRLLKPSASIYICGDWRSASAIQRVGERYFHVRNRITWEREKGRGAQANWKNCSEDIWFFTVSDAYTFNVSEVMLKRRVLAPYRENGQPKKWDEAQEGRFRLTYPSNLWTDVTVPFWSMSENTQHPTQKPEKLLAKIILASSREGDLVLDPFAGTGTTSVVAKKLKRHYTGIEIDKHYCCLAEKRLQMAESNPLIQGYSDGVFWERNTFNQQIR